MMKCMQATKDYGNREPGCKALTRSDSGRQAIRKILLFLSLTVILTVLMTLSAGAATLNETEDNGSVTSANAIQTGDTVVGTLKDSHDSDYYSVNVAKDGYFEITLTHEYTTNSNSTWYIRVYNSAEPNREICSLSAKGDRVSTVTPKIGVGSGTYYVRVYGDYSNGAVGMEYKMTLGYGASDYYENDHNDSIAEAKPIYTDSQYHGFLNGDYGNDYYMLSITENCALELTFEHDIISGGGNSWGIEFYKFDNELKKVCGFTSNGGSKKFVSPMIGLDPGTYYVRVYGDYAYNVVNQMYHFTLAYTKSDYYENALNDTITEAKELVLNNEYHGFLNYRNGNDYYTFDIEKSGYLELEFTHEMITQSSSTWNIKLYKYDNELRQFCEYYSGGSSVELKSAQIGVDPGTYYFRVYGDYSDNAVNKMYHFTLDYTESEFYENALNDTTTEAKELVLNNEYHGFLNYRNGNDYYTFDIEKSGYLELEFTHEMITQSSSTWNIKLYKYDNELRQFCEYYSGGSSVELKSAQIGVDPGTYYFRVYGDYSDNAVDKMYHFTLDYTESEFHENALNDTFEEAKLISVNNEYHGFLNNKNGNDYYQFTVPKGGTAKVKFTHDTAPGSGYHWRTRIYRYENGLVEKLYYEFNGGNDITESSEITVTPGTYYFQVYGSYTDAVEVMYHFTVDYTVQHTFGAWTTVKAATCTASGSEKRVCSVCGDVETRELSALGHNKRAYAEKAATCTEKGYKAYVKCTRCSYTTYSEIPATGHSYTCAVTEPTCLKKGYSVYTCRCGDNYTTDFTSALGHDIVNEEGKKATCTEEGYEPYECCLRCSYSTYTAIKKLPHSYDSREVVTEPTCTSSGEKKSYCKCGEYVSEKLPALGHGFESEWTVDVEPTDDSAGSKSRHCVRCDAVTDIIEIGKLKPDVDSSDKFVDIEEDAWYKPSIDYVVSDGLMNGTSDTRFEPDVTMSRAMIVTVLYRLEGSPSFNASGSFTDIDTTAWYADAVNWANSQGIVLGIGNGKFAPNDLITREQLATIMYRYSQYKGFNVSVSFNVSVFPDAADVSSWALTAVRWACGEKLITGASVGGVTFLAPQSSASRAQFATILTRYNDRY